MQSITDDRLTGGGIVVQQAGQRIRPKTEPYLHAIDQRDRTIMCGIGDRSFGAAGPRIWNSLPCGLRTLDISYKHFKTLLKKYMFDQATALCDILYKRLRNTLTYLLTYLVFRPRNTAAVTGRDGTG